ncbi:MAG TPA: hypothetical protein VKX28_27005 [Xanthobacteraceae bacterium]|nr:hypothetical protein [Xanthobacteraceae bacterium]
MNYPAFTICAVILIAIVAAVSNRANTRDRGAYGEISDEDARVALLQARQDIRLIAYLLMAAILMLGILADRLH